MNVMVFVLLIISKYNFVCDDQRLKQELLERFVSKIFTYM
jgi:hypothetical protein